MCCMCSMTDKRPKPVAPDVPNPEESAHLLQLAIQVREMATYVGWTLILAKPEDMCCTVIDDFF